MQYCSDAGMILAKSHGQRLASVATSASWFSRMQSELHLSHVV